MQNELSEAATNARRKNVEVKKPSGQESRKPSRQEHETGKTDGRGDVRIFPVDGWRERQEQN